MLVSLTLLTDRLTRAPHQGSHRPHCAQRNALAEASRRNAEVLQAMGMRGRLAARWAEANDSYMTTQRRAADVAGGFGSASKVLRMVLQSAVLGVGGYLVIQQEASAGIIIAGAILVVARARAGRARHRPLERLGRRPPELETAAAALGAAPGRGRRRRRCRRRARPSPSRPSPWRRRASSASWCRTPPSR